MSGLRDEKNKVLEITKTCKACKRQCLNIRMDFSKILPTNICNEISTFHTCKICSKVRDTITNEANERKKTIDNFEEKHLKTYYFTRLNPYPTYKKIKQILSEENKEFYAKKIPQEFKEAYENEHLFGMVLDTDNFKRPLTFYWLWHNYHKRYKDEYIEQNKTDLSTFTRSNMIDFIFEKMKYIRNTGVEIKDYLKRTEKEKNKYYRILYTTNISQFTNYELNLPIKLSSAMGFSDLCIRINQYEFDKLFKQLTYQQSDKKKKRDNEMKQSLNSTSDFE